MTPAARVRLGVKLGPFARFHEGGPSRPASFEQEHTNPSRSYDHELRHSANRDPMKALQTKASVIRLTKGHGLHKVCTKTVTRLVQDIQASGTGAWFDAIGFCVIKKRCVTVRRPRGWESWVYFEAKS